MVFYCGIIFNSRKICADMYAQTVIITMNFERSRENPSRLTFFFVKISPNWRTVYLKAVPH